MSYTYSAFISYRHLPKDIAAAKAVQQALETYHIPADIQRKVGRKKLNRCFRDQDELPQDFGKGYFDVKYLHNWNGRLGENHEAGKGRMLVFVIKSELMGNYPDTSIRLAKAVTKDGGTVLESVLSPVMTGWLADDTFMAGFQPSNLPTTQGIYLSFWETDKSLRFYRVMSMNNPASDYLSSEVAVNRVDSGSVWGVEIRPDYLTL